MVTDNDNRQGKSVTLFVPGISQFDIKQISQMIAQPQSLTALELLFSRSTFKSGKNVGMEQTLFQLFDLSSDENVDFPIGALTHALLRGDEFADFWMMRADPVMIQPNRDHLLLMGNGYLDFSMEEAQQIVDDINTTFQDTPWLINALTPKQWVIRQERPEQLKTHSLNKVVGKNIHDYLPKGKEEKNWHAILNELQMFLHSHPVNQHRQMQGLPTANSLWFWGSGKLPELSTGDKPFAQCWSDETISLALARIHGLPRTDLSADGVEWLKQAITPGRHLLVIELLSSEAARNDPIEWWRCLVMFDKQWLRPLINAIRANSIEELKVIDTNGDCYHLTRQLLKRWWKRVDRI